MTAARELGMRLDPLTRVDGPRRVRRRLPPDSLVEDPDEVLAETERLAARYPELVVAPCSPFSVSGRLMRESAELARRLGLQLHTHLAETVEEEAYCQELYGCRPVEYLEQLGWLDGDVWCAHCVHLDDATSRASRKQAPASRTARPRTFVSVPEWPRFGRSWTRVCASGSAWMGQPRTSAAISSSR